MKNSQSRSQLPMKSGNELIWYVLTLHHISFWSRRAITFSNRDVDRYFQNESLFENNWRLLYKQPCMISPKFFLR